MIKQADFECLLWFEHGFKFMRKKYSTLLNLLIASTSFSIVKQSSKHPRFHPKHFRFSSTYSMRISKMPRHIKCRARQKRCFQRACKKKKKKVIKHVLLKREKKVKSDRAKKTQNRIRLQKEAYITGEAWQSIEAASTKADSSFFILLMKKCNQNFIEKHRIASTENLFH